MEIEETIESRGLNSIVYFDITINTKYRGRLCFELRNDIVPRLSENFRLLCTGEMEQNQDGIKLHYKGSKIHRVVKDTHCQGGDIVNSDGTGNISATGLLIPDENFILKHTGYGVLSMVNTGPDTNGSQFFISLNETSWMDNRNVVIGYAIDPQTFRILNEINQLGSELGYTEDEIIISESGQLYP